MNKSTSRSLCAVLALMFIAALLYLPYAHNALIFDDIPFFSANVYNYAAIPFNLSLRTFPYFTLGLVQVLTQSLVVHRLVSLLIHTLNAWMVYRLLLQWLLVTASGEKNTNEPGKQEYGLALLGSLWFAIHPVAVYGAGYLVQRTILLATLFSLLSLWFFWRSFVRGKWADVVTAALFYWLAVFSKEHVVLMPAVVLAVSWMYPAPRTEWFRRVFAYFLLCLPAALMAIALTQHMLGNTSGEIYSSHLVNQAGQSAVLTGGLSIAWLRSAATQAGLFFNYIAYWLIPDPSALSADMRIDFAHLWSAWWFFPKAALFFACPFMGGWLLYKRGRAGLFGAGLLYAWLLFLTELSSGRYQEPFVLYRSYAWAPGYALMLMAVLSCFRLRWLALAAIPVLAINFYLARDRLDSLSSEGALWMDAAAKLQSPMIPGADRIFYNRALEWEREKKYPQALDDLSRSLALTPDLAPIYSLRARIYLQVKRFPEAQADLVRALQLSPQNGQFLYLTGVMFDMAGCLESARQYYAQSEQQGVVFAKLRLDQLKGKVGDTQGKGILPQACLP